MQNNITKEIAAARATLWKGIGIVYLLMGIAVALVLIFCDALVYVSIGVGLVVFLLGMYFIYLGDRYIKKYDIDTGDLKEGKGIAKVALKKFLMVFLPVYLIILVLAFAMTGDFGGSKESKNTCSYCKKSWTAGDSGGNYKNISKTGMCNNCEDNYQDMKQFVD